MVKRDLRDFKGLQVTEAREVLKDLKDIEDSSDFKAWLVRLEPPEKRVQWALMVPEESPAALESAELLE